jgi:glycosyltransferase involved in cell wall biosynthesis
MTGSQTLDISYIGTLPPHHGGSAVMSAQLLDGLAQRGHMIRSIAPITAPVAERGDLFAARAAWANVHRYIVPYFETSPDVAADDSYGRVEFEQVEKLFEEAVSARRPDVVISGRESFAFTVSELACRHGLPWLQMVQGSTAAGILRGTYPAQKAAEILERFRAADVIVTPARHVASALEQLGIGPVRVVPNPVDLKRFTRLRKSEALRERLRIDGASVVVAHISNLKPLKRAEDLVAAAGLLADCMPALVYVVLGTGPERQKLRESVDERGLERRFRFVDWVEHELVPEYMNLADMVVMPSAAEAQALVYLEAQACGRVLLASDIPAAREVVEDGTTGLLFPVGDVQALATMIARVASNPGQRAEIGRNAAERARRNAVASTVSAYETLLFELLSRRSPARAGLPTSEQEGRNVSRVPPSRRQVEFHRREFKGDVTAVLLTMGENSTARAHASIRRQKLEPAEIIVVERVTPFFEALRAGVARVRTPFLIQVDADMVLDETCAQRLRAAMTPEVGIAVGQLRDPLMGTIAGIKLFRRGCFDEVPLRDSVTPDIDFYFDLASKGWLTQHVLSYEATRTRALHTFGDHLPDLTPAYTYSTYDLLGCRYFNRRDLRGFLWRYATLRRSAHPMALTARVALSMGLLHDEERDVPKSSVVAEQALLDELTSSTSAWKPGSGVESTTDWFALGQNLRRRGQVGDFRALLATLATVPPSDAWPQEAALCHGYCAPLSEAGAADASSTRIQALAAGFESGRRA